MGEFNQSHRMSNSGAFVGGAGGGSPSWGSISALAYPKSVLGTDGDIWRDTASYFAPETMDQAFRLCEFLFLNFPTYRKGSERIADYFLTDLKVSGGGTKERKDYKQLLTRDAQVVASVRAVDINYMCYGNAVVSPHFPFTRTLICEKCSTARNIKEVNDLALVTETGKFSATCPKCKGSRIHSYVDTARKVPEMIKLVNWDPKRIQIENNEITGESQYWYSIPEYIKSRVTENNRFFLETLPGTVIEAVRLKKKFKFDPNYIFHLKDSTVAGLDLRGWGVPSILSAFRNFFRLQILMRQDEKLMIDYITPMRLLSPKQGSYSEGNTIMNASMGRWANNMDQIITRHQMDGINWNLVPFPVEYQAIGGEGRSLSPRDLIEAEEDRILNARGIPPEFYRANLSLQAAPLALRLFERGHSALVEGNNRLLAWWSNHISGFMNCKRYEVEFEGIRIIDDIENKLWRLQAMASGILSKETALSTMGVDSDEEFDKVIDQQRVEGRKMQEFEREQGMAALSISSGGEEGGGGQGETESPQTVQESADNAEQIARQLLDPSLPEGERSRQLRAIRETNDSLHAMVIKKMDQLRNQARSIGQDAGMQAALAAPLAPPQEN